ncbi:MAG: PspC domain-containing protein, partial [Gordonia sp. (in: high G+C Gram-positive bacteria)]
AAVAPADWATAHSAAGSEPPTATTPLAADDDRTPPPSWDPLGAAPFAWDLPEPEAKPAVEDRPKSGLTRATLGVAVLAVAAGAGARLAGVDWFTSGRIAAIALAVFGLGLIVDALCRRPSGRHATGLVPLALIAAAVTIVSTVGAHLTAPSGGVGDRTWTVTSQTDLAERYELSIGSSTLDLRQLKSLEADRTVEIRQGVGDVKVLLPDGVRVKPLCDVNVGDAKCPEGIVGGEPDGPVLTIDAHLNLGNMEMKR